MCRVYSIREHTHSERVITVSAPIYTYTHYSGRSHIRHMMCVSSIHFIRHIYVTYMAHIRHTMCVSSICYMFFTLYVNSQGIVEKEEEEEEEEKEEEEIYCMKKCAPHTCIEYTETREGT